MRGTALILLLSFAAVADEVRLADGRVIEGKVVEDRDTVRVKGEHGSVTFPRDKVVKVTYGPTRREEYTRRSAAIAEGDAQGHFSLAGWCEANGLAKERDDELAATLAIDPQHDGANELLGRVKVGDAWMSPEEAAEASGLVNWGGVWVPREEKALREALSQRASLEHQIRRRVADLTVEQVQGDAVQREEASQLLAAVPPEVRASGIGDVLGHRDAEVRSYAAKGLALVGGKGAVQPLAERMLVEDDSEVRKAIVEALRGIEGADPASVFAAHLSDKAYETRVRAEVALGDFPSEAVLPILIDMLENTTYYQGGTAIIVEAGEVPRRPGPLRGHPAPPPTPVETGQALLEREREALVYALSKITGVNMGLDVARWRVVCELIERRRSNEK